MVTQKIKASAKYSSDFMAEFRICTGSRPPAHSKMWEEQEESRGGVTMRKARQIPVRTAKDLLLLDRNPTHVSSAEPFQYNCIQAVVRAKCRTTTYLSGLNLT